MTKIPIVYIYDSKLANSVCMTEILGNGVCKFYQYMCKPLSCIIQKQTHIHIVHCQVLFIHLYVAK